jgi:hypothetical protein
MTKAESTKPDWFTKAKNNSFDAHAMTLGARAISNARVAYGQYEAVVAKVDPAKNPNSATHVRTEFKEKFDHAMDSLIQSTTTQMKKAIGDVQATATEAMTKCSKLDDIKKLFATKEQLYALPGKKENDALIVIHSSIAQVLMMNRRLAEIGSKEPADIETDPLVKSLEAVRTTTRAVIGTMLAIDAYKEPDKSKRDVAIKNYQEGKAKWEDYIELGDLIASLKKFVE